MLMLPYLVEEVTRGGQTMKGIGFSLCIPIMLCAPGRSIGRLKVQSRTEKSFFFFLFPAVFKSNKCKVFSCVKK